LLKISETSLFVRDVLKCAAVAEVHHERAFTLKHEFRVGQIVELKPSVTRRAAAGRYEITLLMPEPDVSSASPRYRIKSSAEIYQRIVPESDLTLSTGPTAGASLLTTEQTLSSSTVLDRAGPDVHYFAAYERFDPFRAILGKKP
jgi:hypothetical protein